MAQTIEMAIWQQQHTFMDVSFENMRKNKFLTDLTISCDGTELAVHRVLLCAASPFFEAMFKSDCKESFSGVMELPTVSLNAAEMILDFIYMGRIPNIVGNREKLKCLLEASHLLQLNLLFQYCMQQLGKLLCSTYFLELWQLATLYDDKGLQSKIPSFAAKHFFKVCMTSDFFNLTLHELLQIIQEPNINVWATDVILDGILAWVKFNPEKREAELENLLPFVGMKTVSAYCLKKFQEDPLIKENACARDLIFDEISSRFADQNCNPQLFCFGVNEDEGGNVLTTFDMKLMIWSDPIALPIHLKLCEDMAVASLNGYVYFIGGRLNNGERSAEVYKYSPTTNFSTRLNNLKTSVSLPGTAGLDGDIYVIGGYSGQFSKTTQRVSTTKGTTELLSPTNSNHTLPIAFAFEKHVYAVGSYDNTESALEKYDPISNQWTMITQIPGDVNWCGGALCNKKLFITCRLDRTEDLGIHMFDIVSGTWDVKSTVGGPKKNLWTDSVNQSIFVMDELGAVHLYDVVESSWRLVVGGKSQNPWIFNLVTLFS